MLFQEGYMNVARLFLILLLAPTLIACGSGPSKNINGNWDASLVNSNSSAAYTFNTVLAQGTGGTVSVTNFSFSSPAPCFPDGMGQTATFSATGSSNGYQTGPFQMTITTLFPQATNNVLQLNGTRNSDGSISGQWTVTGLTGCPASGTFTMTPPIPVDPPIH